MSTAGDYAEAFRDADGQWRVRIKAANNKVIFPSSQGYSRKIDAIEMVRSRFPEMHIFDEDGFSVVALDDEPDAAA